MAARRVLVLPGDGIGQEVIPYAAAALQILEPQVEMLWAEAGFGLFQKQGTALLPETLQLARQVDGILFGATSSPSRRVEGYRSPILTLRQELGLCANIRPVRSWPLPGIRPGVDLVMVRENCEGLYVREEQMEGPGRAVALRRVTREGSLRVAKVALQLARQRLRRGRASIRITIVHKANVLTLTDGLFRDTIRAVMEASGLPLQVEEMLVDAAAMHLVRDPERFELIVAPNLYGDILSDLAAGLVGGLGMAPSLNVGRGPALAEPVHGSAPDIAGQGRANPLAAMLSVGLLLAHWGKEEAAARLETAVEAVLREGIRTPDLGGSATTREVAEAVLRRLHT